MTFEAQMSSTILSGLKADALFSLRATGVGRILQPPRPRPASATSVSQLKGVSQVNVFGMAVKSTRNVKLEQFQENCETVSRPELHQNKALRGERVSAPRNYIAPAQFFSAKVSSLAAFSPLMSTQSISCFSFSGDFLFLMKSLACSTAICAWA